MKLFITTLLASFAATARGATNPVENLSEWGLSDPSVELVGKQLTLTYGTSSTGDSVIGYAFYPGTDCKAGGSNGDFPALTGVSTTYTGGPTGGEIAVGGTLNTQALVRQVSSSGEPDPNPSFCVRTMIGYGTVDVDFEEVNFVESIVSIVYDLQNNFAVEDFQVTPKAVVSTTKEKGKYELDATECSTGSPPFNQGAVIGVCLNFKDPSETAVVFKSIAGFEWKAGSGSTSQIAIDGGQPASDRLTSYDPSACDGSNYCWFDTVLKADFYDGSINEVYGEGSAILQFARRRLGADNEADRLLQEEETIEESPFDLVVELNNANDGPGDLLKTAGGVSVGFTALASFIALAGLMLLA